MAEEGSLVVGTIWFGFVDGDVEVMAVDGRHGYGAGCGGRLICC